MGKLDGKVAIITGAAGGIGAAAARLFVAQGAKVMLSDMRDEPLQVLARHLGQQVATSVTDVTDEEAVKRLVDTTIRHFGRINIALLHAGIPGRLSSIEDYPTNIFDEVMAVNVRGVWLGLKYVMRAMDDGGSIVVTASTSSIRATLNMSAYTVSKHAVIGLMRSAALEGASKGIRVNSVNPATVDTPMIENLQAGGGDLKVLIAGIPMGRAGLPDEVAKMMLFLASDDSSFCTGAVYMVDGGVSAGRS